MKQHELSTLFEQIANLLEYQGENVFRIRAYRRAAETLATFSGDLDHLATAGRLRELSGIGADLAQKIEEYLTTGQLDAFERLRKTVPSGVLEFLEVPGVGPKLAKVFVDRLKLKTVADLEQAARDGRLRALPGFGGKKEENILKAIGLMKQGRERMTLNVALSLAQQFLTRLREVPGVLNVSTAGSLRRMKETIGDLDLLVAARRPGPVMEAFQRSPWTGRVLAAGMTKASILTTRGLQVDLRVVKPASFGAALQYFTGSKEHNVVLRELAVRKGLKVNEYGVFRVSDRHRLAGTEEADVYRALGLAWIPPELRENNGELEAAKVGRLPTLVEAKDIRGDFHIHTNWSDGADKLEVIVQAGKDRGYEYIAICDHSQSLRIARGMSIERIREQMGILRALNARLTGYQVLLGAEVDILADGSMDYPDEVLADLDFVVGSIHSGFKQSESAITNRILRAIRNPYVTLIAHPTGRLIGEREPYQVNLEAVFQAAKETNTVLEINACPKRLDLCDTAARRAQELGVMLAISTDTHRLTHLDHMAVGLGIARRAWVEPRQLLNCLTRHELLAWIARKRTTLAGHAAPRRVGSRRR